jgi:hypothetical protein
MLQRQHGLTTAKRCVICPQTPQTPQIQSGLVNLAKMR